MKKINQKSKIKNQNFGAIIILTLTLLISGAHANEKGTLVIPKPGETSEMSALVERIQKTFAGINDMKGSFSQTSYIKDLEDTQQYAGIFYIKKPSQAMWEYSKPRDEKIVIRDTETIIYKKSENQVIKTKISREAYNQAPITLLGRFENIREDFTISMPDKNALQLIPKKKVGIIRSLALKTVPKGFPVKMFTIIDTYGNIIMIELRNIITNSGLDDDFFKFKIPEGAEVYDMGQ